MVSFSVVFLGCDLFMNCEFRVCVLLVLDSVFCCLAAKKISKGGNLENAPVPGLVML